LPALNFTKYGNKGGRRGQTGIATDSKYEMILDSRDFLEQAEIKFDRRKKKPDGVKKKRKDDIYLEPVEKGFFELGKKMV
jgi:hypothetical protein